MVVFDVSQLPTGGFQVKGWSEELQTDLVTTVATESEVDGAKLSIRDAFDQILDGNFIAGKVPYSSMPPSSHCEACE